MDTTVFFIALRGAREGTIDLPYLREYGTLITNETVSLDTSVTALVVERGQSVVFETDAGYQEFARVNSLPIIELGAREGRPDESEAKIFMPLNTGSITIGTLSVQSLRRYAYSHDDVQTLSVIASQAAVAIENARLFAAQRSRVVELQTIQNIVQKMMPLQDVSSIARLVNDELRQLIDYHSCRLFLMDEKQTMLVPIALGDEDVEGLPPGLRLKVGEGIVGWIAEHEEPVLIPNSLTDARVLRIPGTPHRAESVVGAPLIYEGRVRGVVTLSKLGTHQFDENSLRLLEIVAAQTAIAFDRGRLYDELRLQAATDPLTGLYNLRHLTERFAEEKSRAVRNRHTLAAVMIDIDKFKNVNDTYGHDAGNIVLQELANVIRDEVRTEDIVSRYGGEEFCILLPEISPLGAEAVAERLRRKIAEHRMPPSAGTHFVTVSVGLGFLHSDDAAQELFTRADRAMYEVKRGGGNRLCVATESGFRFG